MIHKNLLKLAMVGLTAGLLVSAQSAQTNSSNCKCKEVPPPKKEVVADVDAQLPKAELASDQKEVAMMKGTTEAIGEMQKFDSQDSCGKSTPCKAECPQSKPCKAECPQPKPCKAECTPAKPCKSCSKCEPKGCVKEVKKPSGCAKCEPKPCDSKKCEDTSKPCSPTKGAAKTAVEG